MDKRLSILLVGIGGYGQGYVKEILEKKDKENVIIAGAVDPFPQNCEHYSKLLKLGVKFFSRIEDFYKQGRADLAVISSPIQYHSPQSCYAMENGSHVLCEKPISASLSDAIKMLETSKKTGKLISIGYQWSHSDAILNLKNDIMLGKLGKAKRLKTLVCWPRGNKYFARNSWAGKIKDDKGTLILDSVANNATAHYLHNMFFVLGKKVNESVFPKTVLSELYRGKDIENFDTVAMRAYTKDEIEIMYIATHSVKEMLGPIFYFEFEKAIVEFDNIKNNICVKFNQGDVVDYGDPLKGTFNKLWTLATAIRKNKEVPCGALAAIPQNICITAMNDSIESMIDFPKEMVIIHSEKDTMWAKGLEKDLLYCYENWMLPWENKLEWATKGMEIDVNKYRELKDIGGTKNEV